MHLWRAIACQRRHHRLLAVCAAQVPTVWQGGVCEDDMTVAELIAKLKTLPQEMQVYRFEDGEDCTVDIVCEKTIEIAEPAEDGERYNGRFRFNVEKIDVVYLS
jgi:hypothetical protein